MSVPRFALCLLLGGVCSVARTAVAQSDEQSLLDLAVERSLSVVDEEGQPVPDARVHISVRPLPARDELTNRKGRVDFQWLPGSGIGVQILKAGHAPIRHYFGRDGEPVPDKLTIRLPYGITVGGRVLDTQGRPVTGAEVRFSVSERPLGGGALSRPYADLVHHKVYTDGDGRWSCDTFPRQWQTLALWVSHPDHILWEFTKQQDVPVQELITQDWSVTLPDGHKLKGSVRDERARPIAGAAITYGPRGSLDSSWALTRSDDEGRFVLGALPEGYATIVVISEGYTPRMASTVVGPRVPPLDYRLSAGETLTVTFRDENDQPASSAYVRVWDFDGEKALEAIGVMPDDSAGMPNSLDEQGRWIWNGMPDQPFRVRVYSDHYITEEFPISPNRQEYVFTLRSLPKVQYAGQVVDAVTGNPVQRFMLRPYSDALPLYLYQNFYAKDGRFEYEAPSPHGPATLEVIAAGYQPQSVGPFDPEDSPIELTVSLQPAD
jgi:hypothetical protein